jgi:hypothetical protein
VIRVDRGTRDAALRDEVTGRAGESDANVNWLPHMLPVHEFLIGILESRANNLSYIAHPNM